MVDLRSNSVKRWIAAAVLAIVAAPFASAQKVYRQDAYWVEETMGTMPAASVMKVNASIGSISFEGSAGRNDVQYTVIKRVIAGSESDARRYFDSYHVSAAGRGSGDVISTEMRGEWRNGSVQIAVHGPKQMQLVKLTTGAGDVVASHIAGRVDVETGAGSVGADDIGTLKIESAGGNMHVGSVSGEAKLESGGGSVFVHSAGGNMQIETSGTVRVERASGDLTVESGGGTISIGNVGGALKVSTGGGNLELGDVGGRVIAETGGGSIRLQSGGMVKAESGAGSIQCMGVKQGLKAETGAGGIVAMFDPKGTFSDSQLEAGMGDITVYIPDNLHVRVVASIEMSNGHGIQSDFSGIKVTREESFGPSETYAEGTLNGGGPTLKLHTSVGNIYLKRASAR